MSLQRCAYYFLFVQLIIRGLSFSQAFGQPVKCGFPAVAEAVREGRRLQEGKPPDYRTLFQREERQKSFTLGNVRVHYDTSGTDAAAMLDQLFRPIPGSADQFADSVAAIANSVWELETLVLGYLPPPEDGSEGGGPEYDIYVLDLSGQIYGRTQPETPLDNLADGGRFTSFIEIDNDFVFVQPSYNKGLPALRVTLAHELHHAIQIGKYSYWIDHVYYHEITSTWLEDVAYTDVNDYYQYLYTSQSQFAAPEIPFTSNDPGIIYSRAVWGHYIAKRFGQEAMRRIWEVSFEATVPPLVAIDAALREQPFNADLQDGFGEWSVWNYFTGDRHDAQYYPEGAAYPLVEETTFPFNTPSDTLDEVLSPLSATYHSITSDASPLTLMTSNVDWETALSGITTPVPYTYYLNTLALDNQYKPTLAGIFVKREVDDAFDWQTWAVVNGLVTLLGDSLPQTAASVPFPNPFLVDGTSILNIPIGSMSPVMDVEFLIFSSDMDLVFSATMDSRSERGRQVMQWNGRNSEMGLAQSGIYFYVVNLPDGVVKGKVALIRK